MPVCDRTIELFNRERIDSVALNAVAHERLLPAGRDDQCEGAKAGSAGASGSRARGR